jgi:acyl-CoA synthetase (AMP-forming)/AMP-acid ligase II
MGPMDWTDLVEELAAPEQADWVALESAGQRMTIKELRDAMRAAVGALSATGGVVAISERDPIAHTVAVLGALAAGRTAMLVDPKSPDALLRDVVDRAGATTIVGRELDDLPPLTIGDLLGGTPTAPVPTAPTAIGTILLTSGSTGMPKLVQRTRNADLHGAMCLRLAGFPIGPGDRHWICVPYAGAPFITLVMGPLLARATVVFAPFARESVDAFLTEHRISSAYLVPTMLRLAREHGGLTGPGWDGMRALMTGGEKLDAHTAEALLDRFENRVYCAYGMTEIPRPTQATFEEIQARPGTVGPTIPFRRVQIAAVGADTPLPVGEEGEVLVTGPDLFRGYLGEEDNGEWYRTGDLGRLDEDGYLYITGRASSVVMVGGNRVSTEEVANAMRGHEKVAQAAVIAVEDPTWTTRLEAFVVAREATDGDELRTWLGEQMASYKVPRVVRFLDELPVDASGKVSLTSLHAMAERTP